MAKIPIPKNPGVFRIWMSPAAGNYIVTNDRGGKNGITIACTSRAQAEELCRRLNAGELDGEITVANRVKRR
jgi:hypothetical protein